MSDSFLVWRSPLHAVADADAVWREVAGGQIVETTDDERESAACLYDLSALPRIGAKGECTVPEVNTAIELTGGALCCRVGIDEIIVLSNPSGDEPDIKLAMSAPRLIIPRRDSHCYLGLTGEHAVGVLSRLCAAPPPTAGEVLQTVAADVSAVIVADPRAAHVFHILTDSGYALHLWHALNKAAASLNGGISGWKTWRGLFTQAGKNNRPPETTHKDESFEKNDVPNDDTPEEEEHQSEVTHERIQQIETKSARKMHHKNPEDSENPESSENPGDSENLENPESAKNPENSENPENPDNSENSKNPKK